MAFTEADFSTRYYGLCANPHRQYRISIKQVNYGGSVREVGLTDNPLRVNWGKRGTATLTPLVASQCNFELWNKGYGSELLELPGSPTGDFLVEVLWRTATEVGDDTAWKRWWIGRLMTDRYEDSTMGEPHRIKLTASDGLGALKAVEWTSETGPYSGKKGIYRILKECLHELSYELHVIGDMNWWPYESMGTTNTAMKNLALDAQFAYTTEEGKQPDRMSCYDVLLTICRRLGLRVFQLHGNWFVIQHRRLTDPTGLTPVTENSDDFTFEPLTLTTETARLKGKRTYTPALSRASTEYEHPVPPPGIRDADFEEAEVYFEDGTDPGGDPHWSMIDGEYHDPDNAYDYGARVAEKSQIAETADNQAGKVAHLREMSFDPANKSLSEKEYIAQNGPRAVSREGRICPKGKQVTIRQQHYIKKGSDADTTQKTDFFEHVWALKVGDYWLNIEADTSTRRRGDYTVSWSSTKVILTRYPLNDYGTEPDETSTMEITTPPHPTGGEAKAYLYTINEADKEYDFAAGILWEEFIVEVTDAQGRKIEGRKVIGEQERKDELKEGKTLPVGTGPTIDTKGALLWNSEGEHGRFDYRLARDFKRGKYASGEERSGQTAEKLLVEDFLTLQASPLEDRFEEYCEMRDATGPYEFGRLLTLPAEQRPDRETDAHYLPTYISRRPADQVTKGIWRQVKKGDGTGIAYTSEEVTSDE